MLFPINEKIKVGDYVTVFVPAFQNKPSEPYEVKDIQGGCIIFDKEIGKIQIEYCTKVNNEPSKNTDQINSVTTCPTCGSEVDVHADGETHYYIPKNNNTSDSKEQNTYTPNPIDTVTRFEVIDHLTPITDESGRMLVKEGVKVELSYQDNNRTLKVFLTN
jgi:DNA-directed RNA polymerase subunit M/transcription elongation factor TFIIS